MGQKRVSFAVAKAIKEAGYPQDYKNAEDTYTNLNGGIWIKPTCFEVWLWLWREKKIAIKIYLNDNTGFWVASWRIGNIAGALEEVAPEEAIEQAIVYLVENNLIK